MVEALIYHSRPLARDALFQHWYQWMILAISLISICVPLACYIFVFARYKWRQRRARPVVIKVETNDRIQGLLRDISNVPYRDELRPQDLIGRLNFALSLSTACLSTNDVSTVDLLALPLGASTASLDSPGRLTLAYCDHDVMLGVAEREQKQDNRLAKMMRQIHVCLSADRVFAGVVLPLSDRVTPQGWMTLAQHLRSLNLLVLYELHPPYTDLSGINLSLVDGLIIRNGTILSTGHRRDFFRGFELRDVLGRCLRQRTVRETFTTILHDPCLLPSPPTLRRAFKFARFHEVLLSVCGPDLTCISNCLSIMEPQSAFDWLKRPDVLDLHKAWNDAVISHSKIETKLKLSVLEDLLPGITATFVTTAATKAPPESDELEVPPPSWKQEFPTRASFFTTGENGQVLTDLACYDLREQITDVHANSVLKTQIHMRELDLLHELTIYEMQEIFDRLNPFLVNARVQEILEPAELSLVQDFIGGLKDGGIRVFRGLDSGFMLPENRFHMWSVSEETNGVRHIYVSLMAKDLTATLLHTFLLLHGTRRRRCFEIELVLSSSENLAQGLPPRLVNELRSSTYAELLNHLHQIRRSRDSKCFILKNVTQFVQYLLVDETTRASWKRTHGEGFLSESISVPELYRLRLDWMIKEGVPYIPDLDALVRMHMIVEYNIVRALRACNTAAIETLTKTLCDAFAISTGETSIEQDFVALMVFCVFRKYGVEETYIESSDRCPVYHFQTDQPGVFSELWVIGSQCEAYFDVTPGILGAMHYARYRSYLQDNPPPADAWNGKDVFTAYHKVENPTPEGTVPGDASIVNPFEAKNAIFFPRLQKFAFLSVFCLPAVCDVMLLVFLGRGVFQTAFMSGPEIAYSTLGLLTALLLCSGTIAWIGSSGGYYLYNSAFDSLNHVMVQKLSGAFCLTLAVGVLGGLGIGLQRGWYAGLIFFLYLMALSTYLNILGILATMHRDGAPLPSGRTVLWKSLPILVISPLITMFVHGHDIIVYIVVIYVFLTVLYINYRLLCAEWSQFHTKIKCIDDKQVVKWYQAASTEVEHEVDYEVARSALERAVIQAREPSYLDTIRSYFGRKSISSDLVSDLAPGIEYSRWLLAKDAGPGGSAPPPYSSAWNNQLKGSLNTYQNFIRGLKEHSAFLQFRYAKNDIGYNTVMFVATLLDRWVAITMSAAGEGPLNLYAEPRNRFAIAFALSYFLSSAVALDYQLQFCWTAVVATSTKSITSSGMLDSEEGREMNRKRQLYWTSLRDLFTIMLMLFGVFSLLLVVFVDDVIQLETFFAYAASYTCVLWFQFNRVFIKDGTKAFLIIAGAIAVGYTTGVILHLVPATYEFHFIDIIAMGTCTSLAGLGSFLATDFGPNRDELEDDIHSPQDLMLKTGWKTHSQKSVGLDWNQSRHLSSILDNLHLYWDPNKLQELKPVRNPELCEEISRILSHAEPDKSIRAAFPDWQRLAKLTLDLWTRGKTKIYFISSQHMLALGLHKLAAIGRLTEGDTLEICLPLMIMSDAWILSNHGTIAKVVCEAMLHETCELVMCMAHSDAVCAELIVHDDSATSLAQRIKQQIETSSTRLEVEKILRGTSAEIVRHCCLGLSVNVEWVNLPADLRRFLVCRILGRPYTPKRESTVYIETSSAQCVPWQQVVARSNTKLRLAIKIFDTCQTSVLGHIESQADNDALIGYSETVKDETLYSSNSVRQRLYYGLFSLFQYIAVVSNGEPDLPREFVYSTRGSSFRGPGRAIVLLIWRLCSMFRRFSVELTLLHSRPELTEILQYCRRGVERRSTSKKITIKDPFKPVTGFISATHEGSTVTAYSGTHEEMPDNATKEYTVATYNVQQELQRLESYSKGEVVNEFRYEYDSRSGRIPCVRIDKLGTSYYDRAGRVTHGTTLRDGESWAFNFVYSSYTDQVDILKATYVTPELTICVFWCTPNSRLDTEVDLSTWLPTSKVSRTIHHKGDEQWDTQYTYHHKRDPTVQCAYTKMKSQPQYIGKPPEWVMKDPHKFITKPTVLQFDTEDLLLYHPPLPRWRQLLSSPIYRTDIRVRYSPLSTSVLRSMLWEKWHKSKSLDGVTACYVDTQIMRNEKHLKPYWSARDSGLLKTASRYLDDHIDAIISRTEIQDSISQNTFLPYKMADLYTMGSGGTANVKTRKFDENYSDTHDRLSIMFLDTGCFPDQPGGVSNCRRDLVNGHTTIRNHVFTESANDFGIPRYQVDRNVQSVKVLPMWGLDYLSPYHGLFDNLLDGQVTYREHHTTERDIETLFVPMLRRLIRGARLQCYTQEDLAELTQTFVDLSIYFEEKDYLKTWNSNHVKRAWRETWLCDMPNTVPTSTFFTLELPTMAQFDEAMELWRRYFFVFSVRLPDEVPSVFQCTHHGVGSLFGVLLKLRRGTTYMIWDHAIYWRESCLNISSSQCILALSVQNMLLGAIKMASHLCYTHADVILPCTNLFNPGWEADIGSDQGRRQHKIGFTRKIDPVVNGISEMERFEPVDKIRSENPTVMMLSNVQFIKDVKNAVFSADIIVNRFKFKKYRLVIYGAMDRTPQYTSETEMIIKSRNLGENVKLAGFGNPKEILKDAWAFMNSSLSEGLPLAIGEAALSGCPVIATDVGATALVISDPKDPKIRYGEIVPPNDSVALARAQIQILAMLGPWAKYCGDEPPPMPETFTTADVDWITQRMYDQTEARRALGRKGRETVLHSFNGNRYLREHEQMYWLGAYRAQQRADPALQKMSELYIKFDETIAIKPQILPRKSKLWDARPWREFEDYGGFMSDLRTGLSGVTSHLPRSFLTRKRRGRDANDVSELARLRNGSAFSSVTAITQVLTISGQSEMSVGDVNTKSLASVGNGDQDVDDPVRVKEILEMPSPALWTDWSKRSPRDGMA